MSAKIISFANQKGGTGKTTVTALVTSAIHQYTNYKIAVIDADFQNSFADLRETELKGLDLSTLEKKPFPVFAATGSDPNEILLNALKLIKDNRDNFDYLFIDMPGSISYNGIANLVAQVNYFFIPVYPDFLTLKSTLGYINALKKIMPHEKSQIVDFYCFFNKYQENVNKREFNDVAAFMNAQNVKLLDNKIYKRVDYEREYRSTIKAYPVQDVPPNQQKKFIYKFIEEVISLTNKN